MKPAFIIAGLFILLVATFWLGEQAGECEQRGGILVRTQLSYACIDAKEL